MKLFKVLLIQSVLLLLLNFSASAQSDTAVLNHIMRKTTKLATDYPIEKVYLHLDKPYYAAGDTIWFKAYLTVDHHQLSNLSRVINVLLMSSRDSLIESLKLQVKNGVAWGSIPLPSTSVKKGNYRIIGYTNWMNNNDLRYFFNKIIPVGDAINNDVATQVNLKSSIANKLTKISAGVTYKDGNGAPYVQKRVSWTVEKDDETIAKGKGETDKNGFIDISFINTKKVGLDSASIVAVIDNGEHKQFTNTFPLNTVVETNDFQFFAEGGQLISGIKSKVAFKAITPKGLGIDAKGTIVDNTNTVVAEFSSSHLGMGAFDFTPLDGKNYTAKVTFADGTTATPDLPKIETGAIGLGLDNTNADTLKLKIQADPSFLQNYQGKTFFIIAKCSGIICFAAKTQLQSAIYYASIPKSKFPTGIVQVTLFTWDGDPISERIAFIQHKEDMLNISLNSDKPSYLTRQKVSLNVSAKANNVPTEGSFSVTVVDDSKVPYSEDSETTILSYLLLTSDITGYIEKPNYYFSHQDAKTHADLDVLLLTQGYRRFSYDGIMNEKYPAIRFLPENGITLSGTLRQSNGIPVFNGNVRLLIPDKNISVNAITNADGKFGFQNVVFQDSSKVTISARNNTKSNDMVVTFDGEQAQRLPANVNKPDYVTNIDSTLSAYIKNSKLQNSYSTTLKEVVIRDRKIEKPTVSHRDYGSLTSLSAIADHTILASQLEGCLTPLECIQSLAMGLTYQDGNFYVTRNIGQGKKIPVAIFLRGQFVDVNAIQSLNPKEIESVEIFVKDELGLINSTYGTDGALVINMKKSPESQGTKVSLADLKTMLPQPNEINFSPKGYAKVRTFYIPRYSGPAETQSKKVDTRSTIYWNPNVVTDKTGAANLEYFNADGVGSYRAIIEGIDKDGNIGRTIYRYTVKKLNGR